MESKQDSRLSFRQLLSQIGPGFLQSACTIGGGTLGASLFLGSFAGLSALWVQPVAMLLGIGVLLMLVHVTLSTEQNPLHLINQKVSPVLGWGWLIATVAANMVWGLPQYNLGTDALTQMILPGLLGPGAAAGGDDGTMGRVVATAIMAGCAGGIMLAQLGKGSGGRLFDRLIQIVVACIVLCFGVVGGKLLLNGDLALGSMARGFLPSPALFYEPAAGYTAMLRESLQADFWSERITTVQRNTALAAISAAVGINMTFLMPFALLARGWGRSQRRLARIDLFIGLLLPFVLVCTFVVAAAAATMHGQDRVDRALIDWRFADPAEGLAVPNGLKSYRTNLEAYAQRHLTDDAAGESGATAHLNPHRLDTIPESERVLAAATIKRNTAAFAASLKTVFDGQAGTFIFGVGVFFIALSTVLVHMLINGYALEVGFGIPRKIGSLLPMIAVVGPFFWGELSAYLVIPTAMIGLMLMPVALWGFLLLGRMKSLGDARLSPLMLAVGVFVTVVYTVLSAWAAYMKLGWWGPGLIAGVFVAALLTSPMRRRPRPA